MTKRQEEGNDQSKIYKKWRKWLEKYEAHGSGHALVLFLAFLASSHYLAGKLLWSFISKLGD